MRLAIVTATIDWNRAKRCLDSWYSTAATPPAMYVVKQDDGTEPQLSGWLNIDHGPWNGCVSATILGVVPAFALGVQQALQDGADLIACLHDDLEIEQQRWDEDVRHLFKACPTAGLCGFGGAKGLGSDDIYTTPYSPMQLVRHEFRSNMRHAEAHGIQSTVSEPVACLDGFSQIGRREFWLGLQQKAPGAGSLIPANHLHGPRNLFDLMAGMGIMHHAYDAALGAFARLLGYKVWYLPVACHHHGGLTAVCDTRYHAWADKYAQQTDRMDGIEEEGTGDQIFWLRSHRQVYDYFKGKGILPIRT